MFDEKTKYLGLLKPHEKNMRDEDLPRLRLSFKAIDDQAKKNDEQLAALAAHQSSTDNPEDVTAAQIGAYTKAETEAKLKTVSDKTNSHTADQKNPHSDTAAQVGAYDKNQSYSKIQIEEAVLASLKEYSPAQNYLPGQMVNYGGRVFKCLKTNGPGAGGVQQPTHLPTVTENTVPGDNVWRQVALPSSSSWFGIAYGNGKFVAIAGESNTAVWSTDGIVWVKSALPSSRNWCGIAFGNGRFVAVANGSNAAAWSTDGIAWVQAFLPSTQNWYGITYGNGRFVTVAWVSLANIEGPESAWSADGATWNESALPTSRGWFDIAFAMAALSLSPSRTRR